MKPNSTKSKIRKILTSRIAIHLYFWISFFFLLFMAYGGSEMSLFMRASHSISVIVVSLFPVYYHFFLFEKYFYRKRYLTYAVLLIAALLPYAFLAKAFSVLVFGEKATLFGMLFSFVYIILITTSFKVLKRSINERLLLQEIKAKQVQTELSLLKAQINPHFLFNTLNNLFGMARRQDKAAADGIARLSHLMRYMIYESNVDRINLKKEIHQIKRLIELQKLRYSKDDKIDINFQTEGDTESVRIPPMLLIPFVENAFKHGISLKTPSFIHIRLKVEESGLQFSVRNSVHPTKSKREIDNAGLGLKNVKRRLELLYPDSHELTYQDSGKTFEIHLLLNKR